MIQEDKVIIPKFLTWLSLQNIARCRQGAVHPGYDLSFRLIVSSYSSVIYRYINILNQPAVTRQQRVIC
jgi:hypothetical protein